MRFVASLIVAGVLLVPIAQPAAAQSLRVNGSASHANLAVDPTLQHAIKLTGPAGTPYWWGFDVMPGPTFVPGIGQIPLGITPYTINLALPTLFPAGGQDIVFSIGDPSVIGLTIYSAAGFVDQGAIVISNGISLTFVEPGAKAGPDACTLVNESVTLDGSGMLDPATGALPVATSVQWLVVGSPAGSNPVLTNDQGAFPVFSADAPGTYSLELQASDSSGLSADHVDVLVYEVLFNSPTDGSFTTGAFNAQGTVAGPAVQNFEINGQPAALTGGAFNAGTFTPSGVMNPITGRVTTATGLTLEKTVTAINGASAPLGSLGTPGMATRISGATLDSLEPPVELALAALPLNTLVGAFPPLPIIPTGIFTATIDFTGASFDPLTVDFDIFPSSGAIGFTTTLNQLVITADVTGAMFGLPYTEMATMTATSVVLSGDLVLGTNAQGDLEVTLQNQQATLNNFNMTVTGGIGLFLNLLAPVAQGAMEAALVGMIDLVPQALNPLLANLVLSADLTPTGIPMQVDFPLNSVVYDLNGLTIANDFRATATAISPNAPTSSGYLSSTGTVPAFGSNTPQNALAYDLASALNDEVLNQYLATMVQNGALELDLTGTIVAGGGTVILTAGNLDALIPGVGFQLFDPAAPATLSVRHTTAPAITFSPSGSDLATLHVGNALFTFLVDAPSGASVPVLELGASMDTGLGITLDPITGVLTLVPGTVNIQTTLRGALAGQNAFPALAAASLVIQQVVPLLTNPISSLPLPTAGIGGGVVEVSVTTANPDTLGLYFDTP